MSQRTSEADLVALEDFLRQAYAASGREWPPPRRRPEPSAVHPPPAPAAQAYVVHATSWPQEFADPFAAIPLPDGGCCVADYGNDRVSVLAAGGGAALRHIPCARPRGLALSERHGLFIAGGDGVLQLDLDANPVRTIGGSADETLHTAASAGSAAQAASATPLVAACGVAVAADGAVFVTDSARHCVAVFPPAVDDRTGGDGGAGSGGCRAFAFGRQGSALGELDDPRGIALHGGFVYVADMENHRVQVHRNNRNATSPPPTASSPPFPCTHCHRHRAGLHAAGRRAARHRQARRRAGAIQPPGGSHSSRA